MKISRWQFIMGVALLLLSLLLYIILFALFGDIRNILFYLLFNLAFLPIEVLLVTLILHELLSFRERQSRMDKMNMVIGAFFGQVGNRLLVIFTNADPKLDEIKKELVVEGRWSDEKFAEVNQELRRYKYNIELKQVDLNKLNLLLTGQREFLLRLLENQVLLEHESFSDLLWAVFHVSEELTCRKDLSRLIPSDAAHIASDIERAYAEVVSQWLDYMRHLKNNYPYLFSLAIRTNPFDDLASPEVK